MGNSQARRGTAHAPPRAAQSFVDALATATRLEVWEAVAEAYDFGARAGLAELGAFYDGAARRVADSTPNTRAVDRLAQETVDLVTQTHRGILRGVEDGYLQVISEGYRARLCSASTPAAKPHSGRWSGSATADCARSSIGADVRRRWRVTPRWPCAPPLAGPRSRRTATGYVPPDRPRDRLQRPSQLLLCDPFEKCALSLDGPDDARTIEVEHADGHGRTVRVDIAGNLDRRGSAACSTPIAGTRQARICPVSPAPLPSTPRTPTGTRRRSGSGRSSATAESGRTVPPPQPRPKGGARPRPGCGSGRSGSASTSTCTPASSADVNASSSAPETCPRTAAPPDVPEHRRVWAVTRSRRRASARATIAPCLR